MKTLLVDCYRSDSDNKMLHYRRLCELHSKVSQVQLPTLSRSFDLGEYDAVVISGSQWMLSVEQPPIGVVEFVRNLRLPTLGVCFGHQLLGLSFGAKVTRGELVERNELVRLDISWPLFAGLGSSCLMLESHCELLTRQDVESIGWLIGAESASCAVEAIRHPELPLFGVQFHPERSGLPGEHLFASFYRLAGHAKGGTELTVR